MRKTCEFCETYIRIKAENKWDHPCHPFKNNMEKVCSDYKIVWTRDACLERYPRLIAHLICSSLGYFSPQAAANAVSHYIHRKPFFCEWYSHMTKHARDNATGDYFDANICLRIGKEALNLAFIGRHSHHGYMSEIKQAKHLVAAELKESGATSGMLASWF